jgi:PAS domain S-box-containing protein
MKLWESEAWIRSVTETAVDAIIVMDEWGCIEYFNRSAERMFGYSSDESLGQDISMLMPSPHRERHASYVSSYLRTGEKKIIGIGREVLAIRKDGQTIPIHLAVSEVDFEGRRLFTGIIRDISDQTRMHAEKDRLVQQLDQRNKTITCLYRVGELFRNRDLNDDVFRSAAEHLEAAFSYPEIARARFTLDDNVHAAQPFAPSQWRATADILVEGRTRGWVEVFYLEERSPHGDGPFLEEEHDLIGAVAGALSEVLERREAEAKVFQASKLASIGELAAGVAHEINNPVNGIINCADILLSGAEESSQTHKFGRLIRSEADRIAAIVRSLLTFSSQDEEYLAPARVCDIVEAVLSLCRTKLSKASIELTVDVPESLPVIQCQSERMQQVIMNLIINAMHALDERHPKPSPDKTLSICAVYDPDTDAEALMLTVEDRGSGIPVTHRERIFDPFFTTKGRDRGTGLGLSVSSGIVQSHGGSISVESRKNEFTRIHVRLPLDPRKVERTHE